MAYNGTGSVLIGIPISCLKMKNHLFLRNNISLTKVEDLLENPRRFLTLDLKTKLITHENTFMSSLCGMVVYKVLKAKVETAFFLTFVLFSFVIIGKEFYANQNFLQPELEQKKLLL